MLLKLTSLKSVGLYIITIIISINPCVCGKFPSGLIKKTVRVTGLVVSV